MQSEIENVKGIATVMFAASICRASNAAQLPIVLCALTMWTARTSALPSNYQQHHQAESVQSESFWRSPCGETVYRQTVTPHWEQLQSLLREISERAGMTGREAEQRKKTFLEGAYNDSDYENYYRQIRHEWLPKPPADADLDSDFENITIESAFRKVYGNLQHYAVGLEQATLDQMFTHEGKFADLFKTIQNSLKQLLCDFDTSIHLLKIQKDADVLRDVMSVEHRKLSGEHKITLRDYIILRDYIHMLDYVKKLFSFLSQHPEKSPNFVQQTSRTPSILRAMGLRQ